MSDCIDEIHEFWFGELDNTGMPVENRNPLWFKKDEALDAELRQRFGVWLERGIAGELDHWTNSDRGLVALVVLLDQFSRNIYRDTALAFAADPKALDLALQTVSNGRHLDLPRVHRAFLYMPLEHAEDIAMQEQCVYLFSELARESDHELLNGFERYAAAHKDVIALFGRFPHRNPLLGRQSTEQELEYLEQHGGF